MVPPARAGHQGGAVPQPGRGPGRGGLSTGRVRGDCVAPASPAPVGQRPPARAHQRGARAIRRQAPVRSRRRRQSGRHCRTGRVRETHLLPGEPQGQDQRRGPSGPRRRQGREGVAASRRRRPPREVGAGSHHRRSRAGGGTAAGVNPRAMPPSRPTSRQQSWGSQALPAAFVSSVARSVFSQGKPSRPKWPPAAVLR